MVRRPCGSTAAGAARVGRAAVAGPTLLGVSTRVLLVAALLCGIAILVAFTVQVLIAT